MPSLTRLFSKSSDAKEKEAAKEARATTSSSNNSPPPPPAYSASDRNAPPNFNPDNAEIPPSLTAGFDKLRLSHDQNLKREQCIAHLKLLECFYRLRQTIGRTDGLFGISNAILVNLNDGREVDDPKVLVSLGEKRWEVYVYRAVDRFRRWRDAIAPEQVPMTSRQTAEGGSLELLIDGSRRLPGLNITSENLPPVGK